MKPARLPLKPLDEALSELLGHAKCLPDTQEIDTFAADGRVLAQDLVSALHVPAYDNSAMDGYAVRCADTDAPGAVLPVSQRIAAGSNGAPLLPGSAARIFTGAPIPSGADAVVMQEDCEFLSGDAALGGADSVRVLTTPSPGQWIRRAGEDVARGAVVLQKGVRLSPAELGLAAAIGLARLPVASAPRVALFSTGDELVMPGTVAPEDMKPGTIYNSNRFFLRAMLTRLGCVVTDCGIVPDKRDATIQALGDAARQHDLILTSGGVSVGEEDHIKPAVQALGELSQWQIAMKPGKPFAYGQLPQLPSGGARADAASICHFIGLPGNPVSSFITFMLLVRPFVLSLQGATALHAKPLLIPAHFDWPRVDKRPEFLRARRNFQGGLDIFPNQSSGVLTSAVWADGLVENPAGQTIRRGDAVRFFPFSDLLA